MLHEPAVELEEDYATGHKMRLGLVMFLIYGLIYAGFVGINLVNPLLMEKTIIFGLNLAVVYGFGLIIIALILALIYNQICLGYERRLNKGDSEGEG